jgi:hypothetical protein
MVRVKIAMIGAGDIGGTLAHLIDLKEPGGVDPPSAGALVENAVDERFEAVRNPDLDRCDGMAPAIGR